MSKYPMTATQEATARRKGWTRQKAGWKKPKSFTPADQDRIDAAAHQRARRQRGAD